MLLVVMLPGEVAMPESPTWQADAQAQNGHMPLLLMNHWPELVTWPQTQNAISSCAGHVGKMKYLVNGAHDHHIMEIKYFTEEENLEIGLKEEVSNQ